MTRRVFHLIAKLLATACILVFVFHDRAKRAEMISALGSAHLLWLACGVAAYGAVEGLAAIRLRMLLRVQGVRLRLAGAFRLSLIAVFFSLFSPGLIGGDVIRILYIGRTGRDRSEMAFATVLLDRALGTLSICLIGAIVFAARYRWLTKTAATSWLAYATLAAISVGLAGCAALWAVAYFRPLERISARRGFLCRLVESGRALSRFRGKWKAVSAAFATTLLAHMADYASFFCAAQAFQKEARTPALLQIYSIMPIVNTITALPISFAGVGVREAVFQTLLSSLTRTNPAIAVLIASTGFLMLVFWGVVGGIWFFLSRERA